jgi:hypothetical protein
MGFNYVSNVPFVQAITSVGMTMRDQVEVLLKTQESSGRTEVDVRRQTGYTLWILKPTALFVLIDIALKFLPNR